MGGSIIGLFGDFGDGWFTSGYTFESHKEGGQESGLLGHFRVGNVVRDMDYLGVERAAQFSDQKRLKKVRFQINGFGQEVVSINGNVLTKDGKNKTVSFGDIRRLASRGGSLSGGSELKVKVKVRRVPLSSLGGGSTDSGSIAINNEDVCTVAYNTVGGGAKDEYDLFYLFSTVEIEGHEVKGRPKSVRGMSNRRATCNDIWALYKGTAKAQGKETVEEWNQRDGVIHLHQRMVRGNTKSAVYLIGNKHNYYLWGSETNGIAISLDGIIWTGKHYAQGGRGNECIKRNPSERQDCYINSYAKQVNQHIGWAGYQGKDFETLTIRSRPGITGTLEVKGEDGIHHSGNCTNHKICVNYPWDTERTLTQKLETKGK